jgi:hypothetical protein
MREQGLAPDLCDAIDARATEIYTACSFQDLTGQRTRKVIGVLRYLEGRINAMIELWGLGGASPNTAAAERPMAEVTLLHGPAMRGKGLGQADVDRMMAPAAEPVAMHARADEYPAFLDADGLIPAEEPPAPELRLVAPLAPREEPREDAADDAETARTADPLAPIVALSAEEKIALFS